jgi:hypothetical protein
MTEKRFAALSVWKSQRRINMRGGDRPLMKTFATAFPILPGKRKAAIAFGKEVMTKRRKDFAASEKRSKVSKEAWFLQQSPNGSMMVVYFEGNDPEETMEIFAKSKDPFDLWWMKQVKDFSGVDMSAPPQGPLPEMILSFGF